MLKNGATERQNGPSYCLVTRRDAVDVDVLTLKLSGREMVLPVFSFEDEARMFLELGALGGGWRVRVTTVGELVSVLFGPCAGVDRVVLDPLFGPVAEGLNDLLSMEREAFIESQLGMQRPRSFGSGRSTVRRQDGVTVPTAALTRRQTRLWSKLFGDGDRLPREKVDAVIRLIDRNLAEKVPVRKLQADKQTIHLRDLSPDKRGR